MIMRLWQRIQRQRPYRAWQRFGQVRGGVLAAGIAYFGFFSLFPAVALAAVVFGFVLQGRPDLSTAVGDSLNSTLPGFVRTPSHPQGLISLRPPDVSLLTVGGVAAFVGLVLSGVGWIGALREGIRAVFGAQGSPGNLVTDKLRDLGVLATLGAAILVSAVLTSVLGTAAGWIAQYVGLGDNPAPVTAAGLLVGYAVDAGILVVLLRVLSGLPLPWRAVRQGALLGAFGMSVVKLFGVELIGTATRNPLFGSLVLVVGLLFWLDLIAQLILLSAAWTANDLGLELVPVAAAARAGAEAVGQTAAGPAVADELADQLADQLADELADELADQRSRAAAGLASLGTRVQDRTALAAGAVLGLTAAVALGAVGRTMRAVLGRR